MTEFNIKYRSLVDSINSYIDSIIPDEHKYIGTILDSMRYSLFAGGKRLRPVLMLSIGEMFHHDLSDIMPYAAAIEMIHTYSLIHDDLPAMDNDDFRRGRPTNHKVYGEAMAVLAGDGLLNFAFEHMLQHAYKSKNIKYTHAALSIARSAGIFGMIGGQVVDIESTDKEIDAKTMEYMHNNKTGALITSAVEASAIICEADPADMERLLQYSKSLGLAFQIIDDILDVTGDEKKLGKKVGSDACNKKNTYISMFGLEEARSKAKKLTNDALKIVDQYSPASLFLRDLTLFLLNREY